LERLAFGTFVDGCVSITKLDCDSPSQFLTVFGCPDASYSLYKCGLSVVDVAYGSDIAFGLTGQSQFFSPIADVFDMLSCLQALKYLSLFFCFLFFWAFNDFHVYLNNVLSYRLPPEGFSSPLPAS
jgi:hypothetical protein